MKKALPSQIAAGASAISSCSNANVLLVNFESYMKHEQTCDGAPGTNVFSFEAAECFLKFLSSYRNYSRKSLQHVTHCLRAFFRYGARSGLCRDGLADCLRSTRVYSLDSVPEGPAWADVLRLLRESEGDKPSDIRASAILMLLAIYGLRPSEVKARASNHLQHQNQAQENISPFPARW